MYAIDATTALAAVDPELAPAIDEENRRQEEHIELIASENYASPAVLQAQGSALTNKYAEGYPNRRYYGGCECVDKVEQLAIDRAKALFGAAYANVQPHSGSQANAAVYLALLQPGDAVLGMNLADGGHLTHGAKVNFSGRLYRAAHYGVHADTGEMDYDALARLAAEHRPKLLVAGFSAYSRRMDWQRFRDIADAAGAYLLVDMAHVAGLVAAGLYPNPVPVADVVTSTTHKTLRGPRGGLILARSNPDLEKKLNSALFPGHQGGPLMHVIAAKAVCFKEAAGEGFKAYQAQVIANARAMAARFMSRGHKVVSGGTDNHMFLVDLIDKGITGKDAGSGPWPGQHHGEPQHGAWRPALALHHQRPAPGHPGGDHAGLQGSRVRSAGGLDVRPAGRCAGRAAHRRRPAQGAGSVPGLPGLSGKLGGRRLSAHALPILPRRGCPDFMAQLTGYATYHALPVLPRRGCRDCTAQLIGYATCHALPILSRQGCC